MITIAETLAAARARLAGGDSPGLDAEILLCHLLQRPRSYLLAWPERELTVEQQAAYQTLLARRAGGEPVAYITGEREFWSLSLRVTPAVLIPRADTELLVELALARIPAGRPADIADLGTGSGAVALAIASERPLARVVAVERSPAALAVARDNAQRLGLDKVRCVEGDWCRPLAGQRFDLIVSNPPYIPDADPHLDLGDLPAEPRGALAAGDDGLDAIRRIVAQAPDHLRADGWLLLEHGYDQGEAVRTLLAGAGWQAVEGHPDLAGNPRCSTARRPKEGH